MGSDRDCGCGVPAWNAAPEECPGGPGCGCLACAVGRARTEAATLTVPATFSPRYFGYLWEPSRSSAPTSTRAARVSNNDDGCEILASPYNPEDPDNDPVLNETVEHAYAPGRSYDQWFDYPEFEDAPDDQVLGMESGVENASELGNNAYYNRLPPGGFETNYRSMRRYLRPSDHGLAMKWIYLEVANPRQYLSRLVDEGKRDSIDGEWWTMATWQTLSGSANPLGNPEYPVYVGLGVQPFAAFQFVAPDSGSKKVNIRYWVGVTVHPAFYPHPEVDGIENWDPDNALGSLALFTGSNDRTQIQQGRKFQTFMDCITGLQTQLITGRHASKNYGYPGNRRFYPSGGDPEFGEAANLADWSRTAFPFPLYLDGGTPYPTDAYTPVFPWSGDYCTAAMMQTSSGNRARAPGAAASYLGNMMTGTVEFVAHSEVDDATRRQLVERGFDCLFGDSVVASVRVGYIPYDEPQRETPTHVLVTHRIRAADIMGIDDLVTRMGNIERRAPDMEWIYNFFDVRSISRSRL